jgi:hypothetical protein
MANTRRKCGGCGEYFRPDRTFPGPVAWCSPDCGLTVARKRVPAVKASQERQERKDHKEAKQRIKTRSEWLKQAQYAVNAYVRERDRGLPCVSGDKPDDGSHQRHASHYRSVKACSVLRFDPRNIYSSCAQCNTHLSGNLIEYRIRLVRRKGLAEVEWLESQNGIVRYTIDDLRTIRDDYRAKLKSMRDEAKEISV